MTISEAKTLATFFFATNSEHYKLKSFITKGKKAQNFHQWADGKNFLGAYLIENIDACLYWFLLIEWKKNIYYLVLFPENRIGPLIEMHKIINDSAGRSITWSYSPTKRDGKNDLRKVNFEKGYLSTTAIISFPERSDDLDGFYDEIFCLVDARLKSDQLENIGIDKRQSFPEGKKIEKVHLKRERNRKLVKLAKQEFKRTYGKLFCQICKFDFGKKYGKVGEDFIEAHHAIPLHEASDDGVETKIEDLVMLCSNCHNMVHKRRPWLEKHDLHKLLI